MRNTAKNDFTHGAFAFSRMRKQYKDNKAHSNAYLKIDALERNHISNSLYMDGSDKDTDLQTVMHMFQGPHEKPLKAIIAIMQHGRGLLTFVDQNFGNHYSFELKSSSTNHALTPPQPQSRNRLLRLPLYILEYYHAQPEKLSHN